MTGGSGSQKSKKKIGIDSDEDSLEEEKQIMLSSIKKGTKTPALSATQTNGKDGLENSFAGIKVDSVEKNEEIESRYSDPEDNQNENEEEKQ